MLLFHKHMANRSKLLEEIVSDRVQGVEFDNSGMDVLGGKAPLAARRAARMWTARVVVETRVSHILIVSDSPSRLRAVNRALEKELKRLGLRFLVNEPVPVPAERP